MALYDHRKGFSKIRPKKQSAEMFLTSEQVKKILDTIISDPDNPNRLRDHCAVFCGFSFGMRIAETVLLSRESFRDIAHGVAHLRTLKQSERISHACKCGRKSRVALSRAGQTLECSRCGAANPVKSNGKVYTGPPEKEPPVIERHVLAYVAEYIESMPLDQNWLFIGYSKDHHMCASNLRKIFAHYVMAAGLNPVYSWHALRHGRGMLVYERFEDLVMVRDMLRQKSTKTAEIYARISPRRAAEARALLEQDEMKLAANPFKKRTE
jgi:site-specific recombinase XerD